MTVSRTDYPLGSGSVHPPGSASVHPPGSASIEFVEALPSKKGRVAVVSIETPERRLLAVSKDHISDTEAIAEENRLTALIRDGVRVPRPCGRIATTLYLEYIDGEVLVDVIERGWPRPEAWCGELGRWFRRLHETRFPCGCRLKGDVNLRNFILDPRGEMWGLDFEESPVGDPAVDIGRIMAFILSTRPHFAPGRREMCLLLLDAYGPATRAGDPWVECRKELRAMADRRPAERDVIERYLLDEGEADLDG